MIFESKKIFYQSMKKKSIVKKCKNHRSSLLAPLFFYQESQTENIFIGFL